MRTPTLFLCTLAAALLLVPAHRAEAGAIFDFAATSRDDGGALDQIVASIALSDSAPTSGLVGATDLVAFSLQIADSQPIAVNENLGGLTDTFCTSIVCFGLGGAFNTLSFLPLSLEITGDGLSIVTLTGQEGLPLQMPSVIPRWNYVTSNGVEGLGHVGAGSIFYSIPDAMLTYHTGTILGSWKLRTVPEPAHTALLALALLCYVGQWRIATTATSL